MNALKMSKGMVITMKTSYKTKGTCSQMIDIDVEDGIINEVKFHGGCPGNLLAIGELVKGMNVSDVINRFDGIRCGNKKTSCADQLAQALKQF